MKYEQAPAGVSKTPEQEEINSKDKLQAIGNYGESIKRDVLQAQAMLDEAAERGIKINSTVLELVTKDLEKQMLLMRANVLNIKTVIASSGLEMTQEDIGRRLGGKQETKQTSEGNFDDLYKQKRLKKLSTKLVYIGSGEAPREVVEYELSEIANELYTLGVESNEKIKAAYDKTEELSNKMRTEYEKVTTLDFKVLKEMINQSV